MVAYDYRQKLRESQEAGLQQKLDRVYRRFFPAEAIQELETSDDFGFQTSGRDVWVRLRGPRDGCVQMSIFETIEEKIRSPERSQYDDLLIEYLSNAERGTLGWIYTSQADWLSYVRQPGGRLQVLLIPMLPLRRWFEANRDRLGRDFCAQTQLGSGVRYTTVNKAIPLNDRDFKVFMQAHGVRRWPMTKADEDNTNGDGA